ncbi:hypothetical protein EBB79_21690 (plasmid) [Parasedimentitalea marina]|uniref:Uncharacterized protein n=1 Tax=Parasedimentitalea marina TaxID=2483033 RepID=A0A3T0N980_9RHOB|nr:hypothetical protein EBB79_21690 [Parasedimentitalea marina]
MQFFLESGNARDLLRRGFLFQALTLGLQNSNLSFGGGDLGPRLLQLPLTLLQRALSGPEIPQQLPFLAFALFQAARGI